MDSSLFSLAEIFDHFPEAALFFPGDVPGAAPAYINPKAALLLEEEPELLPLLAELETQDTFDPELALSGGEVSAKIIPLSGGLLFVLRPQKTLPELPSLGTAAARLREHLSHLFAAWESLLQRLRRTQSLTEHEDLLSLCGKSLYQILRLVQQLELLHQDALLEIPSEPLELSALVRGLCYDLEGRVDGLDLAFFWEVQGGLLLNGRRPLLEQLTLSLLSNAIKAAGPRGLVRLTLKKAGGRAELTVRDNGPGIPPDRLHQLFCPQYHGLLPRPEDGSGLDLYLAHRIATLHRGVLMAGSAPAGGTQITLSLPLEVPQGLTLRSQDRSLPEESLSPLLIGLSDVLPAALFSPFSEE